MAADLTSNQSTKQGDIGMKLAYGRIAAALALATALAAPALAADKVDEQLDWVVRGNHAMFFVARDKGFFARSGIEIGEIRKGSGSPDAMRLTANATAQFDRGDLPTMLVARAQGVPVV